MSATKTSVLQAAVAFLLLCLLSVDGLLGLGATVACVLAFPPVRWGGAQLRSVLVSYAVWLLVWAAFAVGYLRLMSALGRSVEPQAQLVELVDAVLHAAASPMRDHRSLAVRLRQQLDAMPAGR